MTELWNSSISLPEEKVREQDSSGFVKEKWKYILGIPAAVKDATRSDEILANQCGYRIDIVVEILSCNYNGASFFVDEETGNYYEIKRTYRPDRSMMIQLTGERREHGKI